MMQTHLPFRVPGVVFAMGIYAYMRATAYVPVWMSVSRMLLVFILTNALSMGSALLTVHKAKSTDPAELF